MIIVRKIKMMVSLPENLKLFTFYQAITKCLSFLTKVRDLRVDYISIVLWFRIDDF